MLAIVLLAVAALAWRYWPAEEEAALGMPMVDVTLPKLTDQAQEGRSAYITYCAGCHGAAAAGRQGIGPPLVHVLYQSGHHGDAAFQLAALNGTRQHHWQFGDMPAVKGINAADVAGIVVYVRELQRANGIE
ncbi:MAG: c-type cytochrome [Rhizobiales bacterium]|nr:c-type cytochrome [Hyphomicrobiales bacterium]